MKKLKDRNEVVHAWANQTQPEGRASNLYFKGCDLYSYGHHFLIARILDGAVLFTQRGYSSSTARHISMARRAASHLNIIECADPADSPAKNMRAARDSIATALSNAEQPRIREATRSHHRARALTIAEKANAYLDAIRADKRYRAEAKGVKKIDTRHLDRIKEERDAIEAAREALRAEQFKAREADLRGRLEQWRKYEILLSTGLGELPVALRVSQDGTHVETSHGARITVQDALTFFAVVEAVKASEQDRMFHRDNISVGPFPLNFVRADGSAKIGCHDVPYAEMAAVAAQLRAPA